MNRTLKNIENYFWSKSWKTQKNVTQAQHKDIETRYEYVERTKILIDKIKTLLF